MVTNKVCANLFLGEHSRRDTHFWIDTFTLQEFAEHWERLLAEWSNMRPEEQGRLVACGFSDRLRELQVITRKTRQLGSEWTVTFRPRVRPGYCYVCRRTLEKKEMYVRAFIPGEEKDGSNMSVCRDCWDEAVVTPLKKQRRYWSTDKPDALTARHRPVTAYFRS